MRLRKKNVLNNIYPFECEACHHEFEKEMSIPDYEKHGRICDCPKCGKKAIRTYGGSFNFQWKGKWFSNGGEY